MRKISGDFFTSQGPPKSEQIVEISGFQRMRQRLDISIERKKGNIILLIGTRGIGKSTALDYFLNYVILSTGINCAFCIGGTKLIQPTNKDSAPCSHYGFRDLKKLKLWRCEV